MFYWEHTDWGCLLYINFRMYYKDLEPCTYFYHFYDKVEFESNFVAIGWLGGKKDDYTKGELIIPNSWNDMKARDAIKYAKEFPNYFYYMGSHTCEMCGEFNSHNNIFIPDEIENLVYCFPEALYHYITVHEYLPPQKFIDCLVRNTSNGNRIRDNEQFWNKIKSITPNVYEVCKKIQFRWAKTKLKCSFGTSVYPEFIELLQKELTNQQIDS